jgi:hypothetical protein
MSTVEPMLRPAQVCAALLAALDATEGRSRKRKRDQRPDVIGIEMKRALLERVVRDDPQAPAFEEWLLAIVLAAEPMPGQMLATARSVLDEWRLAQEMQAFAQWLSLGAPSADARARGAAAPEATDRFDPR